MAFISLNNLVIAAEKMKAVFYACERLLGNNAD